MRKLMMMQMLRDFMRDLSGSVMMEFIVVMPIYLVLFGGVCAIGDIIVHSGRLLSADRFSAFFADQADLSSDAVKGWVETMFKQPSGDDEVAADGRIRNDLTIESDWHYADATAPWSVCAAARTTDDFYIGAGSGIAQIVVGKHWIEQGTDQNDTGDFWSNFAQNGFKTLHSRPGVDAANYRHSFYVLKRKKYYTQGHQMNSWREVPESSLLTRKGTTNGNSAWYNEVYKENWFTARSIGDHGTKSVSSCPEANAASYRYKRFPTFVQWSN